MVSTTLILINHLPIKINFQIVFFFDAFTLICPLTVNNLESVSIVCLCLHFLLTGCHAGHVTIRGVYHDIDILA